MEQPTKKEELQRLRQIVQVLLRYEGDFIVEQLQLHHLLPPGWKPRKTKGIYQPRQLRLLFEELGASFVKLGQLLSLRTDLLPRAYVEELSRLQDQVKPVAFKAVREVVEDELGAPLEKHFLEFEKTPLSSASVSQVHKARLPDGPVLPPGICAGVRVVHRERAGFHQGGAESPEIPQPARGGHHRHGA